MTRSKVSFAARTLVGLGTLCMLAPALADQWVGPPLTPTAVQASIDAGSYGVAVSTSQAVANPAGCFSTDQYVTTDPQLTNQILAIVLSAIATGAAIQIYVSSSQCAWGRPEILGVQEN